MEPMLPFGFLEVRRGRERSRLLRLGVGLQIQDEVALQDPARGKSTRPKYPAQQSTRPKYTAPAGYFSEVPGPEKAQKLAFEQHRKAREERPTGRQQVAAHASSEREPAGRKREKDDQPSAGRRGDETTQSRAPAGRAPASRAPRRSQYRTT